MDPIDEDGLTDWIEETNAGADEPRFHGAAVVRGVARRFGEERGNEDPEAFAEGAVRGVGAAIEEGEDPDEAFAALAEGWTTAIDGDLSTTIGVTVEDVTEEIAERGGGPARGA